MEKSHSHLLTVEQTKELLFLGKAIITVKSLKKNIRFTYKVTRCKDKTKNLYFCSVLTGPDNNSNYQYFGHVWIDKVTGRKNLCYGKKSTLNRNTPSVQFYSLFMTELFKDNLEGRVEIWHEGKCCKCGKKLTDPTSIERGIGPECFKMVNKNEGYSYQRRVS